jgi:hypothetical protein
MDYHELQKMTAAKLKEKAHEFPELTGVSTMHKEQLIELLCQKLGIQKPHKVAVGAEKSQIKAQIHALKRDRDAAIEAKDAKKLREVRVQLHRLRRRLHHASKVTS